MESPKDTDPVDGADPTAFFTEAWAAWYIMPQRTCSLLKAFFSPSHVILFIRSVAVWLRGCAWIAWPGNNYIDFDMETQIWWPKPCHESPGKLLSSIDASNMTGLLLTSTSFIGWLIECTGWHVFDWVWRGSSQNWSTFATSGTAIF